MINGLAIWHYPTRTDAQNAAFFADHGFKAVSMLGDSMAKIGRDDALSEEFASVIREKNLILTVHGNLPRSHSDEDVEVFKRDVDSIAKWQEKYGLIKIFSFDVWGQIRDNITPYVEYVFAYKQFGKIALEDFCLTEAEKAQVESFKGDPRFGHLIDIGHLNVRINGKTTLPFDILRHSDLECPKTENPGFSAFLQAFRSKEFPIFEIHLHNNDAVNDLHDFLQVGTADMHDISAVLKEINYDGIVTIESVPGMHGYVYPEADDKILETFEYWKDCVK